MSFGLMDEESRINAVRFILLGLTAPQEYQNDLQAWDPKRGLTRKRRRQEDGVSTFNIKTVYSIKGRRLCRFAFSAIVQVHASTLNKHARVVASAPSVQAYHNNSSNRRLSLHSTQTIVAERFLTKYGERNGLQCPTGRGSREDKPVVWLPSDVTRSKVYEEYRNMWEEMITFVVEERRKEGKPTNDVSCPLTLDSFRKVWRQSCDMIRIMKPGSDYCDKCTQISNLLQTDIDDDTRGLLDASLRTHKNEAAAEFKVYTDNQAEARDNPTSGRLHCVFDFAEKVLLPHLLRQPGQLHFVTGLKFDFFGVSVSNLKACDIYCLPEGHWPSGKTANEVATMLGNSIQLAKSQLAVPCRSMILHADNCGGQNKNKFILWYLMWRTTIGMEDDIKLHFLVAGHTKNRCDGAFGLVKRELKRRNVNTPRDMVEVVKDSSASNRAILSGQVRWMGWKSFLEEFYTVPSSFRITKYHVFAFSAQDKAGMRVKRLSSDEDWEVVRLLKKNITPYDVCASTASRIDHLDMTMSWPSLGEVSSAHEGNRKAYLDKNVIQRYYSNNQALAKLYFGDGS